MPVDLSISVVNTNNCAMLRDCLASLYQQHLRYEIQILVVDNASTDGSAEMVREQFPQATLSVNTRRFGFAANNNVNLRLSSGRYCMLLNEDTVVQPGCLDYAISWLDEHLDCAGVACRMINPDGTLQEGSTRRLPTIMTEFLALSGLQYRFPRSRFLASYVMGHQDHSQPHPVELPLEAGMIVRTSVIDEIGGLCEEYFIFGEGPEWCRRIKDLGGKLMYLPACEILHFGGATTAKLPRIAMEAERFRSMSLYFRRTDGVGHAIAFRATVLALYVVKLAVHTGAHLFSRTPHSRYRVELAWFCVRWALGIDRAERVGRVSSVPMEPFAKTDAHER